MTSWSTPITFVASNALTAAQMNTEVRDHLNFLKGAMDLLTNSTTADTGNTMSLLVYGTASTAGMLQTGVAGDSSSRFSVLGSGQLSWGPGSATKDWRFVRTSSTEFLFDANGEAHQTGLFIQSTAGQRSFYASRVTGDSVSRTVLYGDATATSLEFGDGSATRDVNLYRNGVDRLKTDDHLHAVLGVATFTKAGAISDADWAVAPPVGTIAIDTTNFKVYIRTAAATWKASAAFT